MPGRTGRSNRARTLTTAAVAIYAAFLIASPFEHHDLLCHLRTPLHCTACAGSALGSDLQVVNISGVWHLPDAGRAIVAASDHRAVLLDVRSNGRSPPSHA
jgi:hypothetical protein